MGGLLQKAVHVAQIPFKGVDKEVYGSTVSNPSGPAVTQTPQDQAAAEEAQRRAWEQQQWLQSENNPDNANAWEARKGFLAPMLPTEVKPTAPLGGWSYQPGKGSIWMEQQQTAGSKEPPKWGAPSGTGPFKGNRI